jgi:hypothetical protein
VDHALEHECRRLNNRIREVEMRCEKLEILANEATDQYLAATKANGKLTLRLALAERIARLALARRRHVEDLARTGLPDDGLLEKNRTATSTALDAWLTLVTELTR